MSATDMLNGVIRLIKQIHTNGSAIVNITHVEHFVNDVVIFMFRRSGNNEHWKNHLSVNLAIVLGTQMNVNMMKKLIRRVCLWISMVITKEVEFVKTVNITLMESIVTNANLDIIDHTTEH